jgi:SAM-dependent methyltransferase
VHDPFIPHQKLEASVMLTAFGRIIKSSDTRYHFIRSFSRPERVLELGCGPATNSRFIHAQFPESEICGVDILPPAAMPDFMRYQVVNLDTTNLPFPDGHFDMIVFTHVLEHLHNPWRIGSEIHRVLKEGGRIYVEVPNWTSMFVPSFGFKRHQHYPFNFFDDITHVQLWSLNGIYDFLDDACSLQVKKIGKMRNWRRLVVDPLIVLYGLIAGNRPVITTSIWNTFGLSIYGIGKKVKGAGRMHEPHPERT